MHLADLRAGQTLVVAVVPLGEVLLHLEVREAGELCGALRPQARAGEHEVELVGVEASAERLGLRHPVLREIEVGDGGVPPRSRPLGLTVAHEIQESHAPIVAQAGRDPLLNGSRARRCGAHESLTS